MFMWSCCCLHRVLIDIGRQMLNTTDLKSLKPREKLNNMVSSQVYFNNLYLVSCLKLKVELV